MLFRETNCRSVSPGANLTYALFSCTVITKFSEFAGYGCAYVPRPPRGAAVKELLIPYYCRYRAAVNKTDWAYCRYQAAVNKLDWTYCRYRAAVKKPDTTSWSRRRVSARNKGTSEDESASGLRLSFAGVFPHPLVRLSSNGLL